MMTEGQEQRIAELADAAEELVEGINSLNREAGGQLVSLTTTARRSRRMIWALAASLLLDVILTVFIVNLTLKVDGVQHDRRSKVLCPLYQQFINADTPQGKERARLAGQDMVAREEAFAVIRKGYQALECREEKEKVAP